MATYHQRLMRLIAAQDVALETLFASLAPAFRAALLGNDLDDGTIPLERRAFVKQQIGAAIIQLFLSRMLYGDLAPFTIGEDGSVQLLSPIAQLLMGNIEAAMRLGVEQHANSLRSHLRGYPDVIRALQTAPLPPNLGGYTPPFLTVRADGKTLADRLVIAAVDTRRKTLRLLDDLFAEGRSSRAILDTLLDYFSRKGLRREGKVYGKVGLYDIRKIAQSEPTFAYSTATLTGAKFNPFVTEVIIFRTRSVPCPVCDPMAAGSPYPLDNAPIPGFHASCMCGVRFQTKGKPGVVVERMRDTGELKVQGALSPRFFDYLMRWQGE